MSKLEIRDLHVAVDDTPILKGVNLTVESGQTHAIMGPNGSGKSTLAYSIAGHPKYTVTSGQVLLDGQDVLAMAVDERARAGLFLAMQYPVEVPGVSVSNFLRTAATAIRGEAPKLRTWVKEVNTAMAELEMDKSFAERNVNEGFSGGEKKRHEILQMTLLKPKIAILDETDSGLDVDALRTVSEGVNRARETGIGTLLITHYTRILRYIQPDFVHVFFDGRIVESGGAELAERAGDPRLHPLRRQRAGGGAVAVAGSADPVVPARDAYDVETIRRDFPILTRQVHGVPLVYLDSANTSQKPRQVLDVLEDFYTRHNANVARAVHTLGSEATSMFEAARDKVAAFINAPSRDEVIFTKNISESLNLLAYSLSNATTFPGAEKFRIGPGDNVVVTEMEHHSNLVPWQLLAQRTGAEFRYIPIDDDGRLVTSAIEERIDSRTKVVAFVHQSNALGTVNPVHLLVARAREVGALTILDAAQSVPHRPVDVQAAGGRLPRLHRPQAVRPDRGGRALGALRAAGRAAAVHGRRRDDRDGRHDRHHVRRAAAPVRGGHPDDRRGDRAGGGDRLRLGDRDGQHRRARGGTDPVRAAGVRVGAGPEGDRSEHAGRAGRHHLLHRQGDSPARRQPAAGRAGHRGAGRSPLRPAGVRAVRHPGHHPRVLGALHHHRRDRRPGGGISPGAGDVRMSVRPRVWG